MTNGNDAAFSRAGLNTANYRDGLTKREYFAALAMQEFLSNIGRTLFKDGDREMSLAESAVYAADALIIELNKNGEIS